MRRMQLVAEVLVMEARCSDHKPLLVSFLKKKYRRAPNRRSFKFEVSWTTYDECGEKIKAAWNQMVGDTSLVRAQQKLDNC